MLQALIHLIQLQNKGLIALKAEVDKLDIDELFNNELDGLVVGELKTVRINLKKIYDVVKNEIVKNTKFNRIKKKVNNLEKRF